MLYYNQFRDEQQLAQRVVRIKARKTLTSRIVIRFKNAHCEKVRLKMRNDKMNVTVKEVIELINNDTMFHAKALSNKDRCAVYDRNNRKCAEIAYRNKSASFSIALQCNRFDSKRIKEVADMYDTEYKYHACKNKRDYVTVNKNDSDDTLNYMFELLDTVIDTFD